MQRRANASLLPCPDDGGNPKVLSHLDSAKISGSGQAGEGAATLFLG